MEAWPEEFAFDPTMHLAPANPTARAGRCVEAAGARGPAGWPAPGGVREWPGRGRRAASRPLCESVWPSRASTSRTSRCSREPRPAGRRGLRRHLTEPTAGWLCRNRRQLWHSICDVPRPVHPRHRLCRGRRAVGGPRRLTDARHATDWDSEDASPSASTALAGTGLHAPDWNTHTPLGDWGRCSKGEAVTVVLAAVQWLNQGRHRLAQNVHGGASSAGGPTRTVDAARQEANAASRPCGPARPTPEQPWQRRPRITAGQRERFASETESDTLFVMGTPK